jgi:hypothetical protein
VQLQSLHFSVLKVLGRAAIDTRQPAAAVGIGPLRYPSGDPAPGIMIRGEGRGPLAQVVRAHG